jgi:DNA-binding NtrC family response regulator
VPRADAIAETLTELGHPPGESPLRTLDELLRQKPAAAGPFVAAMAPRLARLPKAEAAEAMLALGSALLALGDKALAREHLVEAAALVAPQDRALAARAGVRLAGAELATGNRSGARLQAARAFSGVVATGDADLLRELAGILEQVGETIASEAVSHLLRRPSGGGTDRAETLARLIAALNSTAAGTAEPLFEIVRAIVDETQAARGFLMLYEGSVLRFELGLTRSGRRLAADDFACSNTIVERALASGHPVLVPDLATDLPLALASSARSLGLRSALCAPLRVERRRAGSATVASPLEQVKGIAGVLYVDSTATGSFSDEDARFFQALADATVLALRASGGRVQKLQPEEEPEAHTFGGIETRSPAMRRALGILARVAATDASVVIQGESGTGKELFARAVHAQGRRAKGPFVAVDCGVLSDQLVLHELFGHEEGAFTGAGAARAGLIERASGGTLFLDGADEMPASMQGALLRVLQEGEVRRLGGERPRPVDVRLVASSQRDLGSLVERGVFRHDLLFRLAVVEIRIPPLRERLEDMGLLVAQLLDRIAAGERRAPFAIDPGALERLEGHAWPGNVRELENVLRAAALSSRDGTIGLATIDAALGPRRSPAPEAPRAPATAAASASTGTIEEIERRAIEERLEAMGWNQVKVAESLGVDRTTLRRKITRYGIQRRRG